MNRIGILYRIIFVVIIAVSAGYGSTRRVLVEMLTNSHCFSCIPAYEKIKAYNSTDPGAGRVRYIFYHVAAPGVEDSLYFDNMSDADGRNNYYGPYTGLPTAFFDGTPQFQNYDEWPQLINSRLAVDSPLEITLSGSLRGNEISVTASVKRTGTIAEKDLVIHFVVEENVYNYIGKNQEIPRYVMRRMITSPTGEPFAIENGETKSVVKTTVLDSKWVPENLSVVVFVQSSSTKEVIQSEHISETFFTITGLQPLESLPTEFNLLQNYPNPFNANTTISYYLPSGKGGLPADVHVTLKVYDELGRIVATIVDERKSPGNHAVRFDASSLPSGVYFYRLTAGDFVQIRKLILSK